MNKTQVRTHATEAKREVKEVAGKVTHEKRTAHRGTAEKHGGKSGAVLGEINSDAKQAKNSGKR